MRYIYVQAMTGKYDNDWTIYEHLTHKCAAARTKKSTVTYAFI
ncbi:MAG: hypothetical protein ABIQ88_22845 [Chitinophagaceae bacterium]